MYLSIPIKVYLHVVVYVISFCFLLVNFHFCLLCLPLGYVFTSPRGAWTEIYEIFSGYCTYNDLPHNCHLADDCFHRSDIRVQLNSSETNRCASPAPGLKIQISSKALLSVLINEFRNWLSIFCRTFQPAENSSSPITQFRPWLRLNVCIGRALLLVSSTLAIVCSSFPVMCELTDDGSFRILYITRQSSMIFAPHYSIPALHLLKCTGSLHFASLIFLWLLCQFLSPFSSPIRSLLLSSSL